LPGVSAEVIENLRGLALGELGAIEIDSHLGAAIGGACERLQDWPIGQHIGRHVDFVLGAIDQCNVDGWQSLAEKPSDQIIDLTARCGNLIMPEIVRLSTTGDDTRGERHV
jgi:hypothetical protein